jgi:hypothetical protein
MTAATMHRPAARGVTGIWTATIRDADGTLKFRMPPKSNLRTDSGDDWQAGIMAGAPARVGESGTATSTGASNLTNTGAAFPTTVDVTGATGSYAGHIVACGPNAAGAGSTVYGVIVANTATVLTVDRWVDAGSPFAAGTTPNGTCKYQILPGHAPAWWLALSTTAITPAVTDTVLSGELTSGGFSRTNATTRTHTVAAATYSLSVTFTATATQTINAEAVFTAAGVGGVGSAATSGIMVFENTEPNPPTLVSGDTLAQTVTVSY